MNRFCCKSAVVIHAARAWNVNFEVQEVNVQGHTMSETDLKAWRIHHTRPRWFSGFINDVDFWTNRGILYFVGRDRTRACSTAHRSYRPDHWDGLMLARLQLLDNFHLYPVEQNGSDCRQAIHYVVYRQSSTLGERAFCVSGHWSGILSLSHCGLLIVSWTIVSQLFVAGLRLTFLTSTYRDFIFTLLVFSIIVDICTARPTRVVVGLALNTVM